jgi:hypothetical protein
VKLGLFIQTALPGDTVIEIRSLTKVYGDTTAVDDLSFLMLRRCDA